MRRKPGGLLRLMRPPTLNSFFPNLESGTCVRVIWGAFIQGPVPGKGTKAPQIKYLEERRGLKWGSCLNSWAYIFVGKDWLHTYIPVADARSFSIPRLSDTCGILENNDCTFG